MDQSFANDHDDQDSLRSCGRARITQKKVTMLRSEDPDRCLGHHGHHHDHHGHHGHKREDDPEESDNVEI